MSGHSKWASIKHKKGATDAKRGKLFSRLIKEIQVAARMGGGDPTGNAPLRKAISTAKGSQMPNETIERAVKRGTGELEGINYEEVLYEGTGPGGTLWLVQTLTDNRNRTVAELRKVFERHTGAIGAGGSAAWAFDRKGIIVVPLAAADEEKLMELTMDAGAEDYSEEDERWQILTDVSDLDPVTTALEKANIEVESSTVGYIPKAKKPQEGKNAERCLSLYETLDDHDDTQAAFGDFDVSDEELARILAD
ncbi:MAG: YebC/PmpR family DNA-binding transcriptional regulator [Deltaproteobacteria bacterium]|nr:MAG: YebC/PmpR family DNA-binding transcriptional regulator [Deltaproteobacteria bacterium]